MKLRVAAIGLLFFPLGLFAATAPASSPAAPGPSAVKASDPALATKPTAASDLRYIVSRVNAKLKAGKGTAEDLAPDLQAFDNMLVVHREEGPDMMATVLITKATLYIEVLRDFEEAVRLLTKIKTDYPKASQVAEVDGMLAQLAQPLAAQKAQSALKVGTIFPDFAEKDMTGAPLSLSALRGKVVLVDFWATWCGPCIQELPNVLAAYQKYHGKGFEIVGVTLDDQEFTLKSFLKKSGMAWPQYFDGQGWGNKLAKKYGISSIPATFLLDAKGKIVARDLRGPALDAALAKLLPGK